MMLSSIRLNNIDNVSFKKKNYASKRQQIKNNTKAQLVNTAIDDIYKNSDKYIFAMKLPLAKENDLYESKIVNRVLDILSKYDFRTIISELSKFGMCGNELGEIILCAADDGKTAKVILSSFDKKTFEKKTKTIDINSLIFLLYELKNKFIRQKPTYEIYYEELFQEFLSKILA